MSLFDPASSTSGLPWTCEQGGHATKLGVDLAHHFGPMRAAAAWVRVPGHSRWCKLDPGPPCACVEGPCGLLPGSGCLGTLDGAIRTFAHEFWIWARVLGHSEWCGVPLAHRVREFWVHAGRRCPCRLQRSGSGCLGTQDGVQLTQAQDFGPMLIAAAWVRVLGTPDGVQLTLATDFGPCGTEAAWVRLPRGTLDEVQLTLARMCVSFGSMQAAGAWVSRVHSRCS